MRNQKTKAFLFKILWKTPLEAKLKLNQVDDFLNTFFSKLHGILFY